MVGLLHGWFTWMVEYRVEHTVEKDNYSFFLVLFSRDFSSRIRRTVEKTHFWCYLAGILKPAFDVRLKRLIFVII